MLNEGVLALHCEQPEVAVATFRQVLDSSAGGYLGVRTLAATHSNLGVAYQRLGQDAQVSLEFNAVLDTWPVTEYARYARAARVGAGAVVSVLTRHSPIQGDLHG